MSDPAVKNAASDDNRAAQSHGLGDVSFTESDQEVDLSAAKAPADDNVVEVNLGNLPRVTEQISQAEPGALLTLGRNGDIKVDASPKKSKVSRVHCTIIKNRDGTITVRDGKLNEPSRNGTFYIAPDGEEIRIRAEQRLPPGSVIRLGPDRLVQLPAYEIQSPACDKTFVIGRHAGCSPRLPDSYDIISREHATVFCDNNGKLWIHDGGLAGRSEL